MKDEALKMAKNWFEAHTYGDEAVEVYAAIEQALTAQPAVQEPVAWKTDDVELYVREDKFGFYNIPLYTHPAQPAVPDALNPKDENPAYAAGWNDCRQAMMEMMK
jgi:hypothetical protein